MGLRAEHSTSGEEEKIKDRDKREQMPCLASKKRRADILSARPVNPCEVNKTLRLRHSNPLSLSLSSRWRTTRSCAESKVQDVMNTGVVKWKREADSPFLPSPSWRRGRRHRKRWSRERKWAMERTTFCSPLIPHESEFYDASRIRMVDRRVCEDDSQCPLSTWGRTVRSFKDEDMTLPRLLQPSLLKVTKP